MGISVTYCRYITTHKKEQKTGIGGWGGHRALHKGQTRNRKRKWRLGRAQSGAACSSIQPNERTDSHAYRSVSSGSTDPKAATFVSLQVDAGRGDPGPGAGTRRDCPRPGPRGAARGGGARGRNGTCACSCACGDRCQHVYPPRLRLHLHQLRLDWLRPRHPSGLVDGHPPAQFHLNFKHPLQLQLKFPVQLKSPVVRVELRCHRLPSSPVSGDRTCAWPACSTFGTGPRETVS